MTDDADLLEEIPRLALFADVEQSELQALAATLNEARFEEGERVVRRGQTDVGFHVIVEGEVSVALEDEELAILPKGSFFGEISVLLGEPAVADVVARTPLRCLVVPPDQLEAFLLANPQVMLGVLRTEARRVKTLDESRA